jgi:hypothetical protein
MFVKILMLMNRVCVYACGSPAHQVCCLSHSCSGQGIRVGVSGVEEALERNKFLFKEYKNKAYICPLIIIVL